MMQGVPLELQRLDGTRRRTHLATYGISVWKGQDGSSYTNENPSDPEIKPTLPGDLSAADVAPVTEIWLIEGDDAGPGASATPEFGLSTDRT